MFFRNLTMLRFPALSASVPDAIDGLLSECELKPVGPLELSSRGFIPPFGRDSDVFAHQVGGAIWIAIGGEDKILPAAAINAELAKRIDALERTDGRKPGGRARKRLKEDVIHELLPKALVRPRRTDAYLDLDRGLLVVDTPSRKQAEAVASELRHALGSFPALPLHSDAAPRATLTGWLDGAPRPGPVRGGWAVELADFAILKDAADRGASVRLTHQDLASDEVAQHLGAGKQCTRLGLVCGNRVAFSVDEDLVLRGVRFLDGAVDALESTERADLRAELDARFALMTGELGSLFDVLFPALQISTKGD